MSFAHPTPEPKPWPAMSDEERLAYFRGSGAQQTVDMSAFREALANRRQGDRDAKSEPNPR